MRERKLYNCEPDDPLRCQSVGTGGEGQCRFLSYKGIFQAGYLEYDPDFADSDRCPKHAGSKKDKVRKRLHNYRLEVYQQRLNEFAESEHVKSLRGEIGILRLTLENIVQMVQTKQDWFIYSGRISDLTQKIERLVRTCHSVESKIGMMLDRPAALSMGKEIVDIISTVVKDPEQIDMISNGIIDAIVKATGTQHALSHD